MVAARYMKDVPQYLKEVQLYLKEVQRKSSSLQIHHGACQYLSAKLTEAVEFSSQHFQNWDHQQNPKNFQYFVKKLHQLSKDIHDFVSECYKNDWIFVAVKLADPTEHLSLLVFELVLCTRLVASSNARGARHILLELSRRIDVHRAIKERVVVDKHNLLSKLETHIASTHLPNYKEEKDVAKHLVQRLQSGARLQEPRFLDAFTSQMWCVDHKSLKHQEQIGKGASATVYKTTFLGEEFAEKIFFEILNESFRNEVSILARLSHPHILPLVCCAISKQRCSIVLELMDTDLCHLMRRRADMNRHLSVPFDRYEAVSIMLQIAEGMEYLHRNRIVHKDLKAENILVKFGRKSKESDARQQWFAMRKEKETIDEEHVHVKVADFGLSKIKELSSTTSVQPAAGSTPWMAPELYIGSTLSNSLDCRHHPFKADVYSFGMVCYEILTGCRPFHEIQKLGSLRAGVLQGDRPKLPQGTPPDLFSLIQKCWMFTPTDRPSFTEICESLRHLHCSLMKGTFPNL